jgi:hypothetical protein
MLENNHPGRGECKKGFHVHAEVGTLDHLSPGGDRLALGIKDRLVGVETVRVEGHRADDQTLEWP